MGDTVLDSWEEGEKNTFTVLDKNGRKVTVNTLDILATQHSETEKISIAVVNKEPDKEKKLEICLDENGICQFIPAYQDTTVKFWDTGQRIRDRAADRGYCEPMSVKYCADFLCVFNFR